MSDTQLLAHAVKALHYRLLKVTHGSTEHFGDYRISSHTRSPNEILNHMDDLVTKTITMIEEGHFNCPLPEVLDFDGERNRLVDGLHKLQKAIEITPIEDDVGKRLLQGPILDIATHIGQLAMLNGLNGNKIASESYYRAEMS
ncbi:MAG: hypothetical protein JWP57_3764 [Spirosoma sp.]|nr:hypothetical protein [Spirosoma sp.]